jgi:hypothetical protein
MLTTLRASLLVVVALGRAVGADPCSPDALKLPKATVLETWEPPYTCHPDVKAPRTIIHNQAELTAAFKCDPNVHPTIDFKARSLVIVTWQMSPAAVSLGGFDDGKLLTLVTRYRRNCPKDPQAMPAPGESFFLIPAADAKRTYAEASCTLDNKC